MRCLTLAEIFLKRGISVQFICRDHSGNLIGLLKDRGIAVLVLPAPAGHASPLIEDYAVWLGVSQAEDAWQSIEALDGQIPDWLIVDHYGLDVEWEREIRPFAKRIMVIDDLANRVHECDVLLDQNYALNERRYLDLVPAACQCLLGPRYALLRHEYLHYREGVCRDGVIQKILIFFGGTDSFNLTALVLKVLSLPEFSQFGVDVIIGANHKHREQIEAIALQRPGTVLYGPRSHLADLMAEADLSIGAAGGTTWERMCLGLPSLVISIAENQLQGARSLADKKLIRYVGHHSDNVSEILRRELNDLMNNESVLRQLAVRNQQLVDGMGAPRVVETLIPSPKTQFNLRKAEVRDIFIYYDWANDPTVRRSGFHSEPITWEIHQQWFLKKIEDAGSHLFVLEASGLPVGQIRFERRDDDLDIGYSLDTVVRGRGWGKFLIILGIRSLMNLDSSRLRAVVKYENTASRSIFHGIGFSEDQNSSDSQLVYYLNFAQRVGVMQKFSALYGLN